MARDLAPANRPHQRHRVAVASNRQAPRPAGRPPCDREIAQGLALKKGTGPERPATSISDRHHARREHRVGARRRVKVRHHAAQVIHHNRQPGQIQST